MHRSFARLPLVALLGLAACVSPEDSHDARGIYRGPSSTQGAVTIEHEAIEGIMDPMTMDFALADTHGVGALQPGDKIAFRLLTSGSRVYRVDGLTRLPDTTTLVLAPPMQTAPASEASADSSGASVAAPDSVAALR